MGGREGSHPPPSHILLEALAAIAMYYTTKTDRCILASAACGIVLLTLHFLGQVSLTQNTVVFSQTVYIHLFRAFEQPASPYLQKLIKCGNVQFKNKTYKYRSLLINNLKNITHHIPTNYDASTDFSDKTH